MGFSDEWKLTQEEKIILGEFRTKAYKQKVKTYCQHRTGKTIVFTLSVGVLATFVGEMVMAGIVNATQETLPK